MKLSSEAVDQILHVIATFDRERGIPHDYIDLETVLRKTTFEVDPRGELEIRVEPAEAPRAAASDSGKAKLLEAARGWRAKP